jgi:hypothetical protein
MDAADCILLIVEGSRCLYSSFNSKIAAEVSCCSNVAQKAARAPGFPAGRQTTGFLKDIEESGKNAAASV